MESIYYYSNMPAALREIHRVLENGAEFVSVIDLYLENEPSHQWVETLKVPVQLLGIPEYRSLLTAAGFINVKDTRLIDPTPVPENYSGSSSRAAKTTNTKFLALLRRGNDGHLRTHCHHFWFPRWNLT
jgi:hypothetical protein